ncbi:SDR family NAD(P)-dependent oxidoreductase [Rhizobium pusense]|uniref:SDR family NAD(P)-dependent oxidoreductase n=1 Tax=Agrobacterium pusense TaxID=648995 RepID=UPI001C6ED094|nr:SDR family NAD(P)-dependent oxidoreductase [Agrobacterium pusense]MBW9080726.1 SDR family NAD(P)-dependent oxidoreductase [Agrobacterium pusense]
MANQFSFESSTEDVLAGVDLQGKRALITGVSAGLGVETARALVAHGAAVVGTARDLSKADRAATPVYNAARAGGGSFELEHLDLSSLASVRACADRLLGYRHSFDIVIANAGVMGTPFGRTADGFETQFGTNFLGHFVFVNRIASLIPSGGRVVILSSAAHAMADINLDDPNFERTEYDPWVAYARSKTACILFAVEFDRRHRDQGVRATAVHPGTIRTELQRHHSAEQEAAYIALTRKASRSGAPTPPRWKTVPQGAATSVWAAAVAPADLIGGRYCLDCNVAAISDTGDIRAGVRSYARDPDRAQGLWMKAEKLVSERF